MSRPVLQREPQRLNDAHQFQPMAGSGDGIYTRVGLFTICSSPQWSLFLAECQKMVLISLHDYARSIRHQNGQQRLQEKHSLYSLALFHRCRQNKQNPCNYSLTVLCLKIHWLAYRVKQRRRKGACGLRCISLSAWHSAMAADTNDHSRTCWPFAVCLVSCRLRLEYFLFSLCADRSSTF